MLADKKNLTNSIKDATSPLPGLTLIKGEERGGGMSYTKTNKLVTALYMVTDIIDKDEPLRNKLRTLGTEIISDMNQSAFARTVLANRIGEIMSFLEIASALNIISPMNCNILRKEFMALEQAIREFVPAPIGSSSRPVNLEELFREAEDQRPPLPFGHLPLRRGRKNPSLERQESSGRTGIGHAHSTRIGVQKGSTLLEALSDVAMSDRARRMGDFQMVKNKRHGNILAIIKAAGGNATIKDIKDKISLGGKTLQRELVSMVKDGVLDRTGEKRWSRYFVAPPNPTL